MGFSRLGLKAWGTWRCRTVTSFMSAEVRRLFRFYQRSRELKHSLLEAHRQLLAVQRLPQVAASTAARIRTPGLKRRVGAFRDHRGDIKRLFWPAEIPLYPSYFFRVSKIVWTAAIALAWVHLSFAFQEGALVQRSVAEKHSSSLSFSPTSKCHHIQWGHYLSVSFR